MRRLLAIAGIVLALAALWVGIGLIDRPSLVRMTPLALPRAEARDGELRVTFLGVSTILLDDGHNAILIDGFFSRPGLMKVLLGEVAPDPEAIRAGLERAGIDRLDAVIVAHSHYDHAMDAPEVARRTGALLVGSESTANIGRGSGFPEERLRIVGGLDEMTFGQFRVILVPSRHLPHGMAMGRIEEPLAPPARALDYREGGTFSIFVAHPSGTLLIQSSAGFVEGALAGARADVVLLGVGGLGGMDDEYLATYWREVVDTVGARRVVPIHWDDFSRPGDEPLVPMPSLLDDLPRALDFLDERRAATGVELRWLPPGEPVDPFAGR